MRTSQLYAPTLREVPAEAEVISHKLMLRAGMIRKAAGGLYTYLPLAWRTIKKIEQIIREEMDAAGGQEIAMPIVQPSELWKETGRWEVYGDEMFRVNDRHGREFCLGPTHEEMVTSIVRDEVRSYKQLPLMLYQIQNKYRDEIRPRFGLMRGREFIMKDLYSFDKDEEGMRVSYKKMYDAYTNIFTRCGLTFRPVEADNGLPDGRATVSCAFSTAPMFSGSLAFSTAGGNVNYVVDGASDGTQTLELWVGADAASMTNQAIYADASLMTAGSHAIAPFATEQFGERLRQNDMEQERVRGEASELESRIGERESAVAVLGAGAVYAAARYGSQEDPLVAKSYLTDVIEKEITDYTESQIRAAVSDAQGRVQEQIRAAAGVFQSVNLSAGQTLTCEPGTEVVLLSGSVTASGDLTDTTLGEALSDGELAVNHLYLAGEEAVLTAAGDAALMVRGS